MKIYLASPLGFCSEHADYRKRITDHLKAQGHEIFDPWEQKHVDQKIEAALDIYDPKEMKTAIDKAAEFAGRVNADGIKSSDAVLAILDGAEVDSGTAAEIGYGAGIGKKCYGLRSDLRNMGELPGLPINLQVLYFITSTGGVLFRRLENVLIDLKLPA